MNKKNFLTTSLASVAVLGAVFFASQTSVVKAESQNGPALVQPEQPYAVNGPVNEPALVQPEQPSYDDAKDSTVLDKPDFNGGVNATDAPVNNVSDFKGGVNGTEPAVLDKPEYPLDKKAPAAPAKAADKVADKPAAKEEGLKVLPKTGTTENAALASVGFLGLVLGALPFAKRKN